MEMLLLVVPTTYENRLEHYMFSLADIKLKAMLTVIDLSSYAQQQYI
jgi:hypothetical protein